MDTACLRIKFTPLLQKNPKNNSKCCLEIVPEVSCIQNFDKLSWRQENNFIEYTIPMTYKVILKKRQAIKDSSVTVIKTYHSCVDLLLSSSKSTLNLGSGDVSKIISDTFIFHKNIENSGFKEHVINALTNGNKRTDKTPNYRVTHKTTNTSYHKQIEDFELKENIDNKVKVKTNKRWEFENVVFQKRILNKITSTDDMLFPVVSKTIHDEHVTTHAAPTNNSTKYDSTRRLSLSPICSVSAQGTSFMDKIVASKAVSCKLYDSQKDLVLFGSITTPSDLSRDAQTLNTLSTIIDVSRQNSSKRLRLKCRTLPEIRVAEYMQYIQNEILPLKLLLDDIVSKCSALGITLFKKESKQSSTFNSVRSYTPVTNNSEEITKSNRVVYSVVFDG